MWKCGKLNASKEEDDEEDTFSEDKAEAIITHSSVASSPLVDDDRACSYLSIRSA